MIVTCVRCQRDRDHSGRGLCGPCWQTCKRNGTLIDYRRSLPARADTAEDVTDLFAGTRDLAAIAARLSRTPSGIVRALERHRAALVADGRDVAALDTVLVPLRAQLWQRRYPTGVAA